MAHVAHSAGAEGMPTRLPGFPVTSMSATVVIESGGAVRRTEGHGVPPHNVAPQCRRS